MSDLKKRVATLPFPNIKNAYILVSGSWRKDHDFVEPVVSFLYDAGLKAAEWCPPYGPITIHRKTEEGQENAKKHYFYDYVVNESLNWSQLAVEREGLPEAFVNGNYDYIFEVLKEWAEGNQNETK